MTDLHQSEAVRRVFRAPDEEQQFREQGYVLRPLFDQEQVTALQRVVDECYRGGTTGFHATIQSPDHEYRSSVIRSLPPLFDGLLDDILDDYEPFTASLLIKWPGDDSEFCTHQDWTMVDEPRFRSVNVWCPLVDVDESNGALSILPGSHVHLDHLRCSPTNPYDFVSEGTEVGHEEMDLVPMRAGEALIFDNGLLHGSGPNRTAQPRTVVVVAFKPKEARLLHHYLPDPLSHEAHVLEVDGDFFAQVNIGETPPGTLVGTKQFYGTPIRKDELLRACGREQAEPSVAGSRHPTFRDLELQRELDERGYVVIDLLDVEVVDRLSEIADRVYTDERQGFHASNMSPDHDYRHAVWEEVTPVLEPIVQDLFVDHHVYTASLLMKWPDQESAFHTHQDWTMVDETRFRTVNVWCPLVDADDSTGALRVLPGSHRVLNAIRCSPMPPEGCDSPGWQVDWSEMERVDVAAGQVVVFDHALLHSSGPNRTTRPRPAVAVALKPDRAGLVHYYLPDRGSRTLERFDIDPEFFVTIDIGDRPPGVPSGTVQFEWEPLTKEALLSACGVAVPLPTPAEEPVPTRAEEPAPTNHEAVPTSQETVVQYQRPDERGAAEGRPGAPARRGLDRLRRSARRVLRRRAR